MKKKRLIIRKALVLPLIIGCTFASYGQNTNYGVNSLSSNTSGQWNSAFGLNSMNGNTIGSYNSAFGDDAMKSNAQGSYNTAIGTTALKYNTHGYYNTASGAYSLYINSSGHYNSAHGAYSLHLNTTGYNNTASGFSAMYYNTTGIDNTATGFSSLEENTTGNANTAVGMQAMRNNFTGSENTATGYRAMEENNGSFNVADGYYALRQNQGDFNTALGYMSMFTNSSGNGNTAVGKSSLFNSIDGWDNTAIGADALSSINNGDYNTALGSRATFNSPNGINNTLSLGYNANVTASNAARVGNANVTNIGGQVGWSTLSDGRFKENVEGDVPGIKFIQKLRPVTYNYNLASYNKHSGFDIETDTLMSEQSKRDWLEQQAKSEAITYTGFIAQEVEQAANEMNYNFSGVVKPQNDADHYAIRYAEFVVPLVKATQEQQDELESLKSEIAELKVLVSQLTSSERSTTVQNDDRSLVKCFPNPSTGKINVAIENKNESTVDVSVINAKGQVIYTNATNVRNAQIEINLSNQPAGQYIIQTVIDGVFFQNKVMIQK